MLLSFMFFWNFIAFLENNSKKIMLGCGIVTGLNTVIPVLKTVKFMSQSSVYLMFISVKYTTMMCSYIYNGARRISNRIDQFYDKIDKLDVVTKSVDQTTEKKNEKKKDDPDDVFGDMEEDIGTYVGNGKVVVGEVKTVIDNSKKTTGSTPIFNIPEQFSTNNGLVTDSFAYRADGSFGKSFSFSDVPIPANASDIDIKFYKLQNRML